MRIDEIEARKAEIRDLISADGAEFNVDELNEEVRALNAEADEIRKNAEKEAELRNNVAESVKIEIRKETEKMENTEIRTFAVDSTEYRNAWLKKMMGKELDAEERNAMTATAAIPTETLNLIINRLKKNPLLSKIDLMQIPGYVRIPIYSTNGDAAWATSNEQADALTYIDLTPFQLIKTVEVPGGVSEMAIPAFEAYITEALANKIETALQTAVIIGSGSSQPKGIITEVSSATGTYSSAGLTEGKLLEEMGKLGAEYQDGACWIMPASKFYGEVMTLVSSALTFGQLNDGFQIKLFGKDVVLSDATVQTNKYSILYGQPKAFHMNLAGGIKVDRDDSVGFKSNAVNYRAVTQADGKLDNASAFVRYDMA